jgi:hypothetical protein
LNTGYPLLLALSSVLVMLYNNIIPSKYIQLTYICLVLYSLLLFKSKNTTAHEIIKDFVLSHIVFFVTK